MKRFLCILMAIFMLLTLCSCKVRFGGKEVVVDGAEVVTGSSKKSTTSKAKDTTSGTKEDEEETESGKTSSTKSNSTTSYEEKEDGEEDPDEIAEQWNYDNTYYKLTHDKKLKIGFIGGSVTVGTGGDMNTGCWRVYVQNWLKEQYPDVEFSEVNAAIGGSSSIWGAPRYESWVLENKPDLVFIEFSINDLYTGTNAGNGPKLSDDNCCALMDSMIRMTQKQLPNTDIVMVTVVDKNTVTDGNAYATSHKKVAEYEGIMRIDLTKVTKSNVGISKGSWGDFYADNVHPNTKGYRFYADFIIEQLSEQLNQSKKRNPDKLVAHVVQKNPYKSYEPTSYSIIDAETLKKYGDGNWTTKDSNLGKKFVAHPFNTENAYCIRGDKGATITYEFTGVMVSMFGEFKKGCDVEVTIDGGDKIFIGKDDNGGEALLYSNLENKKHTLTITVTGSYHADLYCLAIGTK